MRPTEAPLATDVSPDRRNIFVSAAEDTRCPLAIKKGDRVFVLAPSSPFGDDRFQRGLQVLRDWGLQIIIGQHCHDRADYLAGDDDARLADLKQALGDPELKLIWAARGGYGATRLLPQLAHIRPVRPKLLVGFSDISALHALWLTRYEMASIHGPVLTSLGDEPPDSRDHLWKILSGQATGICLPLDAEANHGLASGLRGTLFATNLSILAALAGSAHTPDLSKCIVVVEEVGERPYRLDRLWTQIRQAGLLGGVEALVLGNFSDCDEPGGVLRAEDGLRRALQGLHIPIYRGLQVGHRSPNFALPVGGRVALSPEGLELLEEIVRTKAPLTSSVRKPSTI